MSSSYASSGAARQPCPGCGQLVAPHIVYCPRCGIQLKEPAVEARIAREREREAQGAAAEPVPVLEYRGAPDPAPPPEPAKKNSGIRPAFAVLLVVGMAVKAIVAYNRGSSQTPAVLTTPPPRQFPISQRQLVQPPGNYPTNNWTPPGARYPSDAYGRTAQDPNAPIPIQGTRYGVDRRGRLVDGETGEPVNQRSQPGPIALPRPYAPGGQRD